MLTPEQASKITDLRARMLENIRMGKPSHEGITEDEYREALSFTRANRTASVEKAKKGRRKSIDTALETKPSGIKDNPKFSKFLNKNLD